MSTTSRTDDRSASPARSAIQDVLSEANVQLNGSRPWDPQVHDDRFYRRVLSNGSLAAGEAYMDGWWDCESLDGLFYRILRARIDQELGWSWEYLWNYLRASLLNLQDPERAFEVGEEHYDRGNDLFRRMLDERMMYSCAYWRNAETLVDAQEAKLDLICRKLKLEPGMRVLDIGCGWGGFAEYAAETYGVEVVGITVSEEQRRHARERCTDLPVRIRLQDYRDVEEEFDRVLSIGMFEHVGMKNYRTYMETVRRCLKDPDGLSLLVTIGNSSSTPLTEPWIEKYIFPNGHIPTRQQIVDAAKDLFVMEDWHNIGPDYDRTLMAWADNFESTWDEIKDAYSERFYRMWRYYLYQCAGAFRARRNQLWQIVLSPEGVDGRYESVR
jgi:cyclopropane-fatty-acyl-phospholipid synthase